MWSPQSYFPCCDITNLYPIPTTEKSNKQAVKSFRLANRTELQALCWLPQHFNILYWGIFQNNFHKISLQLFKQ